MLYRHLVTKGFDWGLVSKSMILENSSVFTKLEKRYGSVDRTDYAEEVIKSFPDKISLSMNLAPLRTLLASNEKLSRILLNDSEIKSLNDVFTSKDSLDLFTDTELSSELRKTASKMFCATNPLTGDKDVFKSERYADCIPLVTLTGTFPPQLDEEDNSYFNPNGTVTVAEFLDSLNAIKFGSNSTQNRKKSLDNISDEKDFFNEGYQSCVDRYSSPLYNLYTRIELLHPITRLELAYIVVFSWGRFKEKFGSVFDGDFPLGISFNWNSTKDVLDDFEDGYDYKVSKKFIIDFNELEIMSINLKDYTFTNIVDLKESIKSGDTPIPYPMFMALLEMYQLKLFYFEGNRLDPIKEVSRGELAYFLVRLSSSLGGAV